MGRRVSQFFFVAVLGAAGLTLVAAGASTVPHSTESIIVGASGGSKAIHATVRNPGTCAWTSSPRLARFDSTSKCAAGEISRVAHFSANSSNIDRRYVLALTMISRSSNRGTKISVARWKVVEVGVSIPTTTVATTTTAVAQTTSTPYTWSDAAYNVSCTGRHVVTVGQAPEDIETCLFSDVTGGMNAGTFSSNPGSSVGTQPIPAVGQVGWSSDYYKAPTLASSWTIVSVDNGNKTFTWNVTAFYAGLTIPFTPAATVSTPYTYTDTSADASCNGRHVVTAGQPPEDVESCLYSNVAPGSISVGTFPSNPDSFDGSQPFAGVGQVAWASDYYSVPNVSVDATSWTIVSFDNGNGTFTVNVIAYYNGLHS